MQGECLAMVKLKGIRPLNTFVRSGAFINFSDLMTVEMSMSQV